MKTINNNKDSFLNKVICMKLKEIIIIFLIIIRINIINIRRQPTTNGQMSPHSIDKDLNEEFKDIQEYINMIFNGTLYNPNEVFKKSENPKITIVISVYNGEAYLETALLSIQNQDFKDIEIIMVDDCSKDDSVNLIKKKMVNDPRIKLYQNEENKGALYTKTKGVLHAKGKYVMTLDEDDIYGQRDTFSTLYSEAEENNLDMLGFALYSINISNIQFNKRNAHRYIKTDVIFQPSVAKRMYICNSYNCKRVGSYISILFFRTELFINIIKQIDEKFMNVKMNVHDDLLMLFLLTRKARNLRQIKRIFYIRVNRPHNTKIQFQTIEKYKNRKNLNCLAYINYIEFIFTKTNNNTIDKKIPSFELNTWFLKHYCRYNKYIRKKAINVLRLFLSNNYIEKKLKNEIIAFLKGRK